jgi:hypothetical protein
MGSFALIRLAAISVLSPDPVTVGPERAIGVPTGARRPSLDMSLAAALSMLVDERAPVTVVTTSGEETSGRLVALGDDVVTIQADAPARWPAYVRLGALGLCELR